jgi:hypothetical protein
MEARNVFKLAGIAGATLLATSSYTEFSFSNPFDTPAPAPRARELPPSTSPPVGSSEPISTMVPAPRYDPFPKLEPYGQNRVSQTITRAVASSSGEVIIEIKFCITKLRGRGYGPVCSDWYANEEEARADAAEKDKDENRPSY